MFKIDIKPLSSNAAWAGRRFKTPAYKTYEIVLWHLLPSLDVPEGPLEINIEFGINLSNDIDNGIKSFLDVLQKKYEFNDKNIMVLHVTKVSVKRGEEYIKFNIQSNRK